MKQKEITIPLTCKVLSRIIIAILLTIWIIYIGTSNNLDVGFKIFVILGSLLAYGICEWFCWAVDRIFDGKPIWPIKINCKCNKDGD